ncbi:MAG: CBS domain-containing protein, partial [Thaumarchaeota archaeon]|nr:CBS domain-containing protein [Nitrososphaerota archaeon]
MGSLLYVRDMMVEDVKTVPSTSTVLEAVKNMNKFRIGSIIVVDEGKPVGIVTQGDILRRLVEPRLNPASTKIKDIMSKPLRTINSDASVEEAAKKMITLNVKRLVVVKDGKLVGIVSTKDLTRRSYDLIGMLQEFVKARYVPT